MARFTIGASEYQSKLFDGLQQVKVLVRLLPAFGALAGTASKLRTEDGATPDFEQVARALEPVTVALSKLSDADVEFLLNACYEVTSRAVATGTGWVPLTRSGDEADTKFATRMQVAWHVISENFADMFSSFGVDVPGLMASRGTGQ